MSPRGKLGQLDGEAKGAYEARLLSEAAKAKVERLNFFVQRHLNSLRAASIARAGTLPERCTVARTVCVCVLWRTLLCLWTGFCLVCVVVRGAGVICLGW